ncbi:anthranilate phosphoribosyltransferase [Inhella inkyongensis]|uniref:Anthranilate phosphoribosyltransferase n=1 Tax=Inhella inkyongensis TaxID=392593 RepID=A0A840S4W2_9BURK|nr:DNA-binding protein YbiB [Inhella inkyongensis]MBB5203560.1 anthranilate phosphoribosyltransferase [Inhella inkyongensis]
MNKTWPVQHWIKEIGRGARGARDLDRLAARDLFGALLDGEVDDLALGALLLGLRIKGESCAELLGFAEALALRTQTLQVPAGPRLVVLPSLNGARKLFNAMPLLALHLAAQGQPVLVHGRFDFGPERANTLALFEALGHAPCSSLSEAQARLATQRLAVLPTALLCPGLDRLMALRTRMGVRNCGHTLAKLLDPAPGRSLRVIALTHGEFIDRIGQALPELTVGGGAALLMQGCEGEAYPHPRRPAAWAAALDGRPQPLPSSEADLDAALQARAATQAEEVSALREALEQGPAMWPRRWSEWVDEVRQLAK